MIKLIDTAQKKIGVLISSIGLAVVIINFVDLIQRGNADVLEALTSTTVGLLFLSIVPFFVSIFVENRFLKILQIGVFFLNGALNLLSTVFTEFYGPALFLSGWLLMRHYGFLETYPKTKNALVMASVVILSQISAFIHQMEEGAYAGLTTLAFFLFLIIFILILWGDMIAQQRRLQEENKNLKTDYRSLASEIEEIEEKQKPYDLKAVGITPAEERVIRVLTLYKASNKEIAERLNLAESTVKLHLYKIYNKIGVDDRFSIIELCKYNFRE